MYVHSVIISVKQTLAARSLIKRAINDDANQNESKLLLWVIRAKNKNTRHRNYCSGFDTTVAVVAAVTAVGGAAADDFVVAVFGMRSATERERMRSGLGLALGAA